MTTSPVRRRRRLATAVLAAALVALSACSSSDDDPQSEPSASASSEVVDETVDENAGCELLTAAERKRLLGSPIDAVAGADARESASQCRWTSDKGLIQVTDLAAEDWAKTLPDIVAQLETSTDLGDADSKAQLAEAKKLLDDADSFTGDQACAAFSKLAEISGDRAGTSTTLTYLPISETAVGISSQTCSGGRLTSILFSTPGLKKSKKVERRVAAALAAAHERALARR